MTTDAMVSKHKYHIKNGVTGMQRKIYSSTRIVTSKEGTFREITLKCGRIEEVRLIWYKHNEFDS